jgi:hypothetical protein
MLRIFTLLSLFIISSHSFAQVNPWPWNALAPKAEISGNGMQVMAVKRDKDEVIVVVFGEKPSPAYEAVLTEMPGLLPDIIDHGENKGPVLRFELKKKDSGVFVPQVVVPFAVTKSIKTNSKSLWIVFEKDEAILVDVIAP